MPPNPSFPTPPNGLNAGGVSLYFDRVIPPDPVRGLAPYYHFRILNPEGRDAGHWNLRVGDSEHIRLYAGHVGYGVHPAYRGNHYAWWACLAAAPFVRMLYREVIITADPDNIASVKTIEKLGAVLIEQIAVPRHDPQYAGGSRRKARYRWVL